MRWLAVLLFAALGWAQTYPEPPVVTVNGPLSCGVRVYAASQVQMYCFYLVPGQSPVTVCNQLDDIGATPVVTTQVSCNVSVPADPAAQPTSTTWTTYFVGWSVGQSCYTGPIVYTASTSSQMYAFNSSGALQQTGNGPNSFQTGTL